MTTKEQLFKEAELDWDLGRLLDDLASVKGQLLTPVEELILRGVLCGHTPTDLAEMRVKSENSQRTGVSRGVSKHVKKLMKLKGYEVHERISPAEMLNLLKKAGYKKAVPASTDDREKNPIISVQGLVKMTATMFKGNKEFIHIEIEKLGMTLSTEQLEELVNMVVGGDEEKKQLVKTLINLVKTVAGGEKKEKM